MRGSNSSSHPGATGQQALRRRQLRGPQQEELSLVTDHCLPPPSLLSGCWSCGGGVFGCGAIVVVEFLLGHQPNKSEFRCRIKKRKLGSTKRETKQKEKQKESSTGGLQRRPPGLLNEDIEGRACGAPLVAYTKRRNHINYDPTMNDWIGQTFSDPSSM